MTTQKDEERGWYLFYRERERQYDLTYRVRPGVWRKHRVPRNMCGTLLTAEKYSALYYAKMKKAGFPSARPATGSAEASGAPKPAGMTFGDFADEWTSGRLAAKYPDTVTLKKTSDDDEAKANVLRPLLGHVPLASFTLDHAEDAKAKLESLRLEYERAKAREKGQDFTRTLAPLSRSTRRQYAQFIRKLLGYAVYPGRHMVANPIPKGWLPKVGPKQAKSCLYPDEDAKLMAYVEAPLLLRLLFGFLDREGMRSSEARGLTWSDLDLTRGTVTLDENKTDDPRAWALTPGVTAALRVWCALQQEADKAHAEAVAAETGEDVVVETPAERGERLVFAGVDRVRLPGDGRFAESLRDWLLAAGVDRPELYKRKKGVRLQLRAHDLRATFITVALANGRTEDYVTDRTGHKSSTMVRTYKRTARSVGELGLGDLTPLDEAIPELRTAKPAPPPEPALPTVESRRQLVADLVAAALLRGARKRVSLEKTAVARAGIEPATRGFSILPFSGEVRSGAGSCDESGIMGDVALASPGIGGTETMVEQQASASPHQAAELLRRELVQVDGGDFSGARDVLEVLLGALES